MLNRNINVQIDRIPGFHSDRWLVSLGFLGGCALSQYQGGDGVTRTVNRAFWNVFSAWTRREPAFANCTVVARQISMEVIFEMAPRERSGERLAALISDCLRRLRDVRIDGQAFSQAKDDAMQRMREAFRDPLSRSYLKARERLNAQKGFSLQQLIDDYSALDLEEFSLARRLLFTLGNACIYVVGDVDPGALSMHLDEELGELVRGAPPAPSWRVPGCDPYLLADCHVRLPGRERLFSTVLYLACPVHPTTLSERRLLADIIAGGGKPDDDVRVLADAFDTGVFATSRSALPNKDEYLSVDEESFESRRLRALRRYGSLMDKSPGAFMALGSEMLLMGVDPAGYLAGLAHLSLRGYRQLLDRVDPFVRVSQVVMYPMVRAERRAVHV